MDSNSDPAETVTSSPKLPALVYLSLGSNVGDRKAQLQKASAWLAAAGRVVALSSFYETEPVEFTQQPWFLNCAVALETTLAPEQLMTSILRIEEEMGRRRVREKGPRTIDIDILLFGNATLRSLKATIPHPAMHPRRFLGHRPAQRARAPRHPVLQKTVRELRDALPQGQAVRKLQETAAPDLTDLHR
jgi:2-amino-4-hydroxy-6-hydroxymethyldihydropteridine diphosphokinase